MTPKRKRPTDLTRNTVHAQKDLARVLRAWADDLEKGGADMDALARKGTLAAWAQRRAERQMRHVGSAFERVITCASEADRRGVSGGR
jgi:hypothetical protein